MMMIIGMAMDVGDDDYDHDCDISEDENDNSGGANDNGDDYVYFLFDRWCYPVQETHSLRRGCTTACRMTRGPSP